MTHPSESELRALDLDNTRHEARLITLAGSSGHSITGRFIRAEPVIEGHHLTRITLEIEIDLGPGYFTCCLIPVNGDFPIDIHPATD